MSIREQTLESLLEVKSNNILCELPTSFGKSKIALKLLEQRSSSNPTILIVIPRLVLIENWKSEFKKWGYEKFLPYVKFISYISFPKNSGIYDVVIFDEVHHLSERCRKALKDYQIKTSILLSATVSPKMKQLLHYLFKDLFTYKVTTKQAIEEDVLPDPTVYLYPLTLDNTKVSYSIIKNPKKAKTIIVPFKERWKYSKVKDKKVVITCTQLQYYNELTSLIKWYKNKAIYSAHMKNAFLKKSGDRLKWLSKEKTDIVKQILKHFTKERTLTFCSDIKQTEELGKYCINSKNKEAANFLALFNQGKIKHITACNMLDEGVNLVNCKVGIYACLNSSDRMIAQKLGRLLRHEQPVIVIPFFKNTRDEEIVDKMLENYNPKLIKTFKL